MRDRRAHQKAYRLARKKKFYKLGLRSDGKPHVAPKPCGCRFGSCIKCKPEGSKLIYSVAQVAAMKRDYDSGMSRSAVERKYGCIKGLQHIFERRGFKLRPPTHMPPRDPRTGKIIPHTPATAAQLTAMIATLKRLAVPVDLKHEWRLWPLAKRAAFVQRLRKIFPSNRPTGKFSANVTPFVYGDPRVHAIAKEMNKGRNSRNKVIALRPCSEGVIYNGMLFFWDKVNDYIQGSFARSSRTLRPILKRVIYEEHFDDLPADMLVIQKDGNKNNFLPENLGLISRAENAGRNHWMRLPLAEQKEVWEKTAATRRASTDEKFRRQVAVLFGGGTMAPVLGGTR